MTNITEKELNDLENIVADINKKADSSSLTHQHTFNHTIPLEEKEIYTFEIMNGNITLTKCATSINLFSRVGNGQYTTVYHLKVEATIPHSHAIEMIEDASPGGIGRATTVEWYESRARIQSTIIEKSLGIQKLYAKIDNLAKERTKRKKYEEREKILYGIKNIVVA